LIRSRHPAQTLSAQEIDSLTGEELNGRPLDAYGVWAYYPWSRRLVHLLDESNFVELRTNRNRYKITPEEQRQLASKRVGIIGLSVGQSVAAVLALERSVGELRLADFDTLELSNLNRIRAGVHSLGMEKVYVTAREIAELDPFLKVIPFAEGITEEDVEAFMLSGGKLDTIVEECDSFDIKLLVRERARAHGIPVVMDTSDRGMLDIERFDLEPTRPVFHGLAGDLKRSELRNLTDEQKIAFVLRILSAEALSPRLRASLLEIGETISTWPQLGSAVSLGGAAAADAVRRMNLGQTLESGRWFVEPVCAARLPPAPDRNAAQLRPASRQTSVNRDWHELIHSAVMAPSGGNMQPWRWIVSAAGGLHLFLDQSRTSGLTDFEDGGSYLALGCATENLVLAAHSAGFEIQIKTFPSPGEPTHSASFRLVRSGSPDAEPHFRDELSAQIPIRQTQRVLGVGRSVPASDLDLLYEAVHSVPGIRMQWQTSSRALDDIAEVVGAVDRIRLLHPVTHRELVSELRWSQHEAEQRRDGIDIEALGLSAADRAGLALCRDWSSLELLSETHRGRSLGKISEKQIRSATAVGLISMVGSCPLDYFMAGRAIQRMWLTASALGIAVHPVAAPVYFFARVIRGGGEGLTAHTIAELRSLRSRFAEWFELTTNGAEALLFRIGYASFETKRSLRRPVEDVLRYE
jgi:tRNA A37 threonylcarbamoyladenosine dehydratase/nitroreductase